jgi:hypothetical protein
MLTLPALEPEAPGAPERDADDRAERRRVAVPADRRAGRVALNERLDELARRESGECASSLAGLVEPRRDWLAGLGRARLVVVAETEMARGPSRRLPVQNDGVVAERRKTFEQRLFLGRGQNFRPVDESFRLFATRRYDLAEALRTRFAAADASGRSRATPGAG